MTETKEKTEQQERDAIAALFAETIEGTGVQWCGGGCLVLDARAHRVGVASGSTLHLDRVPEDRAGLRHALTLIGRMSAVPNGGKGVAPEERQKIAERFADQAMRDAGLAIRKPRKKKGDVDEDGDE